MPDRLLIVFSLVLIGYYVLHSVLATTVVKEFFYRSFINPANYRIFYNALAIILLLPVIYVYHIVPEHILFSNSILKALGILLLVFGGILFYFALQQYNLWTFSGLREPTKSAATDPLNTSGLNSYVRHPLYSAGFILLWAWFLIQPSSRYLVLAMISSIYLYLGTLLEEQKLLKEFGDSYRKYRQQVPMFFPSLKKIKEPLSNEKDSFPQKTK